ncbi:MAG TPA: alpha/beta hydrolase [Pseudonocardiaceae bacterium]
MTAQSQPPPAFPLPIATSIAPADTSDTIVLDPQPAQQISIGAVELRRHDDVVYRTAEVAGGRALALDLLRPATDERLPLLVYLPGGGFMMANKTNAPVLRAFVAESGFVVASAEYRTAGDDATYVDSVRDVHAAVAYLRTHADEYGIDPHAVGVWGESAGGYVAAMTGVTNELDRFGAGPGSDGRVDAVVDSFGAADLAAVGACTRRYSPSARTASATCSTAPATATSRFSANPTAGCRGRARPRWASSPRSCTVTSTGRDRLSPRHSAPRSCGPAASGHGASGLLGRQRNDHGDQVRVRRT